MRVDAPVPSPENVQSQKVAGSGSPAPQNRPAAASSGQDQAQLSGSSTTLHQLKTSVSQLPEVRQDRVDALRQSVSNGSYKVSNEQLSNAMGSELLTGPAQLK